MIDLSLVAILDEAYSHGVGPSGEISVVSSQAAAYIVQKCALFVEGIVSQSAETYSPDVSFSTGEPVPIPEPPKPPAEPVALDIDALPDGWTGKADACFACFAEHFDDAFADTARNVSNHIHAILYKHAISDPHVGEGTVLGAAVHRAQVAVPRPTATAPDAAPTSSQSTVEISPPPFAAPTVADASTGPSKQQQPAQPDWSPLLVPTAVDEAMDVDTTPRSPSPASTPSLAPASPRPCVSPEELPLTTPIVAAPEILRHETCSPVAQARRSSMAPPPSPPRHTSPTGNVAQGLSLSGLAVLDDLLAPEEGHSRALTPLLPVPSIAGTSSPPEADSPTLATPVSAHAFCDILSRLVDSFEAPRVVPSGTGFLHDYPPHVDAARSPRKTPPPSVPATSSSVRAMSPPRASSPATSLVSEPTLQFVSPPLACPAPCSPFVTVMHAVARRCGRFDLILLLSHVCSPLRKILLGDPELWTHLILYSTPSVDVLYSFFVRSATDSERRLLYLDLVLRQPAHIEDLLPALGDALPRTRHLAISVANPKIKMYNRALKSLMDLLASPDLTSLHLYFSATGRPTTLFGGTAAIARLTCQLWQLERVALAELAAVREFVALPPPRGVDKKSHSAKQLFKVLPGAQTLVLAHPLFDPWQHVLRIADGWRPLRCLVLDQRPGPAVWGQEMTSTTLAMIQEQLIEVVVIVRALVGTTNLVRERLSDAPKKTGRAPPEKGVHPVTELALFGLGGAVHCALACDTPARARVFLDASRSVLCALRIQWACIRELHVAAHMPSDALAVLLAGPAPDLCALTVWANAPADGLHPLLALRNRRLGIGHSLQEIRVIARPPRLPVVCDRFLDADGIPAPPPTCTVSATELSDFFAFHGWGVAAVTIFLGAGVKLTGTRVAVQHLIGQVAAVVQENV